jgi:hypothetical protein
LSDAQLETEGLRLAVKQDKEENDKLKAANRKLTANIVTLVEQARVRQSKWEDSENTEVVETSRPLKDIEQLSTDLEKAKNVVTLAERSRRKTEAKFENRIEEAKLRYNGI